MTHTLIKTISLALAMLSVVFVPMLVSTDAEANELRTHSAKSLYMDAPLRRSSGRFGTYYCDYVRVPNRVCFFSDRGRLICKINGWTLRPSCF